MSSRVSGSRRRSSAIRSSSIAEVINLWLPRMIETLWLITIGIVPLVFAPPDFMVFIDVPKIAALRILTGLLAALWAIEWAMKPHRGFGRDNGNLWNAFKSWLGADVSRWIFLTATLFLIANIISALFAPDISVSIWGSNPGRDGYGLYNMASLYILFAVIATHLKTADRLWRILRVIAGVSTVIAVYGILQHFGVVPLYKSVVDRVQGTFGNALFAGSYFVLTITISAGAALVHSHKSRSILVAAIWIGIIATQMAAILLTLSRGPWIALAIALIVWMILLLVIAGRASFVKAAVMLGGAFAIAMVVSYIPVPDPPEEIQAAGAITDRASSIGSDLTTDGLNGRAAIWKRAVNVLPTRPWFDDTDEPPTIVRHLFGYGQDMFLYSTPVLWLPGLERSVNASAHNYLLHVWVELGIVGLAAFVALLAAVLVGGGLFFVKHQNAVKPEYGIILAALLAAVIGRTIEQMTGVARISDLMLFWLIAGIIAALVPMIRSDNGDIEETPESSTSQKRHWTQLPALGWAIAIVVVMVTVVLIFQKNVNYLQAASLGVSAAKTFNERDLPGGLDLMDKAISAAPDVELYYKTRADMMNAFIAQSESDEIEIATEQYGYNKRALEANPLSHTAIRALAESAFRLAQLGVVGKGEEAIGLYTELSRRVAGDEGVYQDIAITYLALEQPEQAVQTFDDFDALTGGKVKLTPKTHYLRGAAYQDSGNAQEAVRWLKEYLATADTGIERTYVPMAHQRLADLYGELGDTDMQARHLAAYQRLSGK